MRSAIPINQMTCMVSLLDLDGAQILRCAGQGIAVGDDEICLHSCFDGSFVCALAILSSCARGKALQGFPDRQTLLLAQKDAAAADTIDGAPESFEHIRLNHRGILMKCDGDTGLKR